MKNLLQNAFSLSVIVLVIQACGSKPEGLQQETANDVIPVKVIGLAKTKIQPAIKVSGQLTTDDETYLSFKTAGVIRSIKVKEGDAIRKGQVLATLDLTEINAQVSQARLGFEKAQRDYNRVSRLYKDSVATLEQFQNGQTGLSIAQKQLEAAEFNRNFSEIRALADGYILRKFVSEGQVITSGSSVLLTNGAKQGRWIVRCGLGDRDWSAISLKDEAVISMDAFPNEEFDARVTRKSEGTDPASGSFTVELTINEKSKHSFATGMFGKASITPSRVTEAWTIPFDAVLDGDAEHGYVFITNDNKTARKVNVAISGINRDYVQVISGLENAKALIVSGSAYLTDSSAIRVIE
ncbi:efflux RND transporter periplasmic adaptor subunit [soil metagenome]